MRENGDPAANAARNALQTEIIRGGGEGDDGHGVRGEAMALQRGEVEAKLGNGAIDAENEKDADERYDLTGEG